MTTPWRSVQDAEKANETVRGRRCHAVYQGVAYPNTENCGEMAQDETREPFRRRLEPIDLIRAEGESG